MHRTIVRHHKPSSWSHMSIPQKKCDRQRSSVSRRSEVVAVEDWRARFERRAAAGRRGRASSGEQEEAARV